MDPKPVSDSSTLLSHWMGVTDANASGNIHGGVIMKLVDEAGNVGRQNLDRAGVVVFDPHDAEWLAPPGRGQLDVHARAEAAEHIQ